MSITDNASELRGFQSKAMLLDERLTMSARLAASSGDPPWEERYRCAEQELEVVLQRTQMLLQTLLGENVSDIKASVEDTRRINDELVKLEHECFSRLHVGDRAGAASTVMSHEYDRLKARYADAVTRSDAAITGLVDRKISETVRSAITAGGIAALLVSMVGGWIIVSVSARHEEALAERTMAAESALASLGAFKAALDQHNLISVTDHRGQITEVNDALCRVSQYAPHELIGSSHRILNSGVHPKSFWSDMWRTITRGHIWAGEVCDKAKDGTPFWVDTTIAPIVTSKNRMTGYVASRVDITQRKRFEKELWTAAHTDRLTGLANRALLIDRVHHAIERSRQEARYQFAILFLDFDRFKLINDSLGHAVGDQLLKEIAGRLLGVVTPAPSLSGEAQGSTVARFGGDEFVVLLSGIHGKDETVKVAERLLETLAEPYRLDEHEVFSTASIGLATFDGRIRSVEEALRHADIAMYQAKLAGMGRCVQFSDSMRDRAENRLVLETDLRKAIDANQFFLMYQPIISLATRDFESVEALIRWNHPEKGMIGPGEFIPIAEDMGLIVPISEWVLRESCRQFARWRGSMGSAAPKSVSVNLSRNHLAIRGLPETIRGILQETSVPPECLHLELTEGSIMQDVGLATRLLTAIKESGVKLCIDDFGTGHSSLSCLHQFPIDILKIDRSFVANIERGRSFIALVHATSQLAHNLGIRVVAEGIENLDQVAVLQSIGCEFGQGFLFSEPLMPEQIEVFHAPPIRLAGQRASGAAAAVAW